MQFREDQKNLKEAKSQSQDLRNNATDAPMQLSNKQIAVASKEPEVREASPEKVP